MKRLLNSIRASAALTTRSAARGIAASLPDLLLIAGAAALSYGAWLIYAPAGFICGGALLLAAGVLASLKGR